MVFELPRREIEALVGAVDEEQAELLTRHGQAVLDAPRKMSLVSRGDLGRLGEHFIDSAALLSVADAPQGAVADLGSGAGFPGVVVAVLRPRAAVTLVESRRSKAVFLKEVKRRLGLRNLEVRHDRLERLQESGCFDLVVARALGRIENMLELSLRLVRTDGRLVLFKGPLWQGEEERAAVIAARVGYEIARTTRVELPGLGRTTWFVEFHVKPEVSG